MGQYIKYYDNFDTSKFIMQWEKWCYIHYSILKPLLNWLIKNWYEILWYDGIIIDNSWTLWPLWLIFDFSRKNYSPQEKNNFAIMNTNTLFEATKKYWYNMNNLYIDLVIKKI